MNPFIAQIVMFGGNFAPRAWANCDGQLLPISQYSALFSILGTMYGGDGRTTFGLPDMRGRVPVHPGNGPGLSDYRQGAKGGREQVTLTIAELPSHNHTGQGTLKAAFTPPVGGGSLTNPSGASLSGDGSTQIYSNATPNVNMKANDVSITTNNTGMQRAFDIRQPWCTVRFIIALQGVFPSRS